MKDYNFWVYIPMENAVLLRAHNSDLRMAVRACSLRFGLPLPPGYFSKRGPPNMPQIDMVQGQFRG